MTLETAAKLLEREETDSGEIVYGDFWIEDEHYEVKVESQSYLSGVTVEIGGDEEEEWTEHNYLDSLKNEDTDDMFVKEGVDVHVKIDDRDRTVVLTTYNARLPETDEELEAYARRAIDSVNSRGLELTI